MKSKLYSIYKAVRPLNAFVREISISDRHAALPILIINLASSIRQSFVPRLQMAKRRLESSRLLEVFPGIAAVTFSGHRRRSNQHPTRYIGIWELFSEHTFMETYAKGRPGLIVEILTWILHSRDTERLRQHSSMPQAPLDLHFEKCLENVTKFLTHTSLSSSLTLVWSYVVSWRGDVRTYILTVLLIITEWILENSRFLN